MSPSLNRRVRIRALLVISTCTVLVTIGSVWASRQQAGAPSGQLASRFSTTPFLVFDRGSISPEASSITVNSTSDVANGTDGLCTLREAITAANSNAASGATVGECAAGSNSGSDVISFTVTGTIDLASVLPDIASDMSINGPGSAQLTVRRNSAAFFRILNVTSGTVALAGFTVRDGRTADAENSNISTGAGIQNFGTLTMNDVTVTANVSGNSLPTSFLTGGAKGGGIFNQGTLTMSNCAVTGNTTGSSVSTVSAPGGDGGGVYNAITLTMTNCLVSGNKTGNGTSSQPGGRGGGIYSSGSLTLTTTTVSNNLTGDAPAAGAGGPGGGIFITSNPGPVSIINSTVSGNSTGTAGGFRGYGGGIYNQTTLTIIGSTVSDNTGSAAAVVNEKPLIMINSTVSGNHLSPGIQDSTSSSALALTNCTITGNDIAGVQRFSSLSGTVRNSIIAANGTGADVTGNFTSQGFNLIGDFGSSTGFTNGVNGDQVGTSGSSLNPQLGPLANNGGLTQTHALLSGSPALDAGDDCVAQAAHCGDANISQLVTDQRGSGFVRSVDGPDIDSTATADIGAYETQTAVVNLPNTSTNEDTQLTIPFDGGDTSAIISVTATSDNPTLVPNDVAHLSVAITGSTGIVAINPATNLVGTTNITVTVNRTGGPETVTFLLTVNPVNDPPSFTKGADQAVNEDSGAQTVSNWATAIAPGPANETGQTLTFQVTGNTNAGLFSAGPAIDSSGTLTYTPAANGNGSATITLNLKDNGGTASGGVDTSAVQTFTITVNAVNDVPSFTKGADQTINEDGGAQTVTTWATSLSRGPADESGQTLTFTATNNNNALFSAQPAIGSTGTLTYTPAANANGTATVTVTLKDNGGTASGGVDTSAAQTFTITVNPVNDAPSFTKGGNQTVNEDAGAQTVNNWATAIAPGPADETGQTLTFQVTGNTNAGLFSSAPVIDSSGTLTYTPAANGNGSATITLNLKDNGGTASGGVDTSAVQTFTITVNAVNDVPSFTKGADQTVNEDGGAQTVTTWATSLSRGPADESGQTLTFTATNDNNALFSTQPAISSTGTLTYTPAANANGTATVSVTLKDNGGTANGGVDTSVSQTFTITVNAVNDVPSFTKGANQAVNEDAGAQTVNSWATAISAGPANESGQTLTFQVTGNTNAALFSSGPAISSTGTLTYTPTANANGAATITLNLQDSGGTANSGADTSAAQTFTITVNSLNDAPSFIKGADQTVNNNAGGQSVVNWATAIAAGPTNESGQTLTFQITSNTNSSLFSAGPTVSPDGTLAYVPASNAGGTATITIRLQDNGGTANGGIDTSASQSFNITVIPVGGFINFSPATYNTTESSGSTTVTVKRIGDLTRPVTVNYASAADNGLPCSTANGVATPKCDFTAALGTLSFAAGEDTKGVNILIGQDGFIEGPETFTVALSSPSNFAALGPASTATTTIADDATEPAPPANVIDDARNFVRQHYHDFLNREPDQSGWDFWTNQITSCGSDVQCTEVRRIDVSASFFLSIEFQQTGYLVERFYKVGYGDATGNSTFPNPHTLAVPIVLANEFLTDTQRIGRGVVVLQPGWEQVLENNKQAYALEFIQAPRFTVALPTTMTPTQFVTKLNQNAGGALTLAEQQTAINLFGGAGNTTNQTARAQAVRMVAEDQDLYNAEFNRAFVLAQYFGYLRRNPNDAPDSDYTGYDFWLTKLNQFNGSYINAEMVKAFLSSIEYRQRFGS